jgi:isopentenyl phosphate kinase
MRELVFLKLGGSLITDKTKPYTVRIEKLTALAREIRSAAEARPDLQLLLGHGSGSFGHYAAQENPPPYILPADASHPDGGQPRGRGYAEIWYRASQLNRHVVEALHAQGIASMAIAPSAQVTTSDGAIRRWDTASIRTALEVGITPLIYGDIVFDERAGSRILSTEDLMAHLADSLQPGRILLAGLEAAVWADYPTRQQRVERITPANYDALAGKVGGSHGADVTGGMKSKVEQMLDLVRHRPGLTVQIFSGEQAGHLARALQGEVLGTLITG